MYLFYCLASSCVPLVYIRQSRGAGKRSRPRLGMVVRVGSARPSGGCGGAATAFSRAL
ncbi:hypothetical protein SLEP1_g44719 [Rubroshorea leprosula]|uniref:Uncharacterized protein n=1 Tax=Rubroshorea leprosula TaxID=152421 RepID=A0AAV5LH03_9ROSI|nr:hypothetical protein SLEP1_g44719 [Rubroshorea leprosula]